MTNYDKIKEIGQDTLKDILTISNEIEDDSDMLKQISKELISLSNKPEIKLMMHERGYKVKWEIAVVEKYPIVLGG